jgi:hypothetical protein
MHFSVLVSCLTAQHRTTNTGHAKKRYCDLSYDAALFSRCLSFLYLSNLQELLTALRPLPGTKEEAGFIHGLSPTASRSCSEGREVKPPDHREKLDFKVLNKYNLGRVILQETVTTESVKIR